MEPDADTGAIAVPLPNGETIRIRAIAATDGDALNRFHERLSSETTRLRFFTMHPHLSAIEVDHFTHVDHHERDALVALDGDDVIGVGRFERLASSDDAEVAFVVDDPWQGHGVATQLLRLLVERARAEGITRFVADTLGENYRMRAVFRRSGMAVESTVHAGVIHVALQLPALSGAGPATP
jgi:RimJ/RimL family protein N-acetyltransferase